MSVEEIHENDLNNFFFVWSDNQQREQIYQQIWYLAGSKTQEF